MFDFVIFCLGQEKASTPQSDIFVEIGERYSDIWKFISGQNGVWYNLYVHEKEIGGTELCEHLGFEQKSDLPEVPNTDSDITDCLTVYKLDIKYKKEIRKIIEYYIEASPIKLIYVLARYQCEEKEIVRGTYTVEKFFSLMENNQLYANICYVLSGNENAL